MTKYMILAAAASIAVPAAAQTGQTMSQPGAQSGEIAAGRAPMDDTTSAPAQQAAAPAAPAPAQTAQSAPMQPDPAQAAPAQSAPAQSAATASTPQPAPAGQQAAAGTQVAQVVGQEFATYDKDANGTLDRAEFSAWMVALKTAADPATKADAPATTKWVGAAFAQADKDKSRSLSPTELTGFLSQGQS